MRQTTRNFLFTMLLLGLPQYPLAITAVGLHIKSLPSDSSANYLATSLRKNYPQNNNVLMRDITLTIGVEALENALLSNHTVDIATGLTEAETLQLVREFPTPLTQTVFVLRQAGFKCQMDLFKRHNSSSSRSLGVLLKNKTRILYPLIKKYAEQLTIRVTTWQSQLSETLADGLNQLLRQQDVVILLAQAEFNQSPQLSAIVQQAKILQKPLIAASEYQINSGITQGCIIHKKDWLESLLIMIEKVNRSHIIKSNHLYSSELSNFRVIMPKITIIE